MVTDHTQDDHRARELARSMDCLTVEDVCSLYDITESTAEAWRKRGKGPAHIQAGNRALYPKRNVAEDLRSRERARGHHPKAAL